ncbi:hypothetical protein [Rubinisphaera italica]|uniref:Uncharacterized protein n=1 Tax=Rubinisphaera italica TaxID=2527969 RepID=A0A5C5XEP3_9PLAN|nr:hypothetical protein [Rubinisphaera italica]TWT61470.1 hypothetical protein Pan54_22060 [Rubinisphaera italica]
MYKYTLCALAILGVSLVASQSAQASNWQFGVSGNNYGFTVGSYNRGYNNSPSFHGGNYGHGYGNSGYGNSGYGHSNYGYGNSNHGNYGYGNNYGRSNRSYYSQPYSGNHRCH